MLGETGYKELRAVHLCSQARPDEIHQNRRPDQTPLGYTVDSGKGT
jgi:hypothetical protein